MVSGKLEDQDSYQRELGYQLRVMCTIKIFDSIFYITAFVFNSCDNISSISQVSIHRDVVKSQLKQADLIWCLSDVYQSIDSGMTFIHVYVH